MQLLLLLLLMLLPAPCQGVEGSGQPLKSLSEILKGKQGRFRQYLLGKRVHTVHVAHAIPCFCLEGYRSIDTSIQSTEAKQAVSSLLEGELGWP
jgi:hypothetical protein